MSQKRNRRWSVTYVESIQKFTENLDNKKKKIRQLRRTPSKSKSAWKRMFTPSEKSRSALTTAATSTLTNNLNALNVMNRPKSPLSSTTGSTPRFLRSITWSTATQSRAASASNSRPPTGMKHSQSNGQLLKKSKKSKNSKKTMNFNKPLKSKSKSNISRSKRRSVSSLSDASSLATKEQFYHDRLNEIKSEQDSLLKSMLRRKYYSHSSKKGVQAKYGDLHNSDYLKNTNTTLAEKEEGWKRTLRTSATQSSLIQPKSMKFSKYSNNHTRKRDCHRSRSHGHGHGINQLTIIKPNKTLMRALSTPLLIHRKNNHELSNDQLKILRLDREEWSESRGFLSKATNPVTSDEYYRYFNAFQAASTKEKFESERFISHRDLHSIAKSLGIKTNIREMKKVADIFDSNGSARITFAEMVHALSELKSDDAEPFIGGQMTIEMMLLANARRTKMKEINEKMSEEKRINSNASLLYFHHRSNFSTHTRRKNLCHFCFQKFDYSPEFEDHLLQNHLYDDKYFTCFQCGKKWIPVKKQLQHIAQHRHMEESNDTLKCVHCQTVLPSRATLAYHNSQMHKPLALDIFDCSKCGDSFSTLKMLAKHQKELHSNMTASVIARRSLHPNYRSKSKNNNNINHQDFEELTAEEFRRMQSDFIRVRERGGLKNRVTHIRTIQQLRNTFDDDERRVSILQKKFDEQDEKKMIGDQIRKRTDVKGTMAGIFDA